MLKVLISVILLALVATGFHYLAPVWLQNTRFILAIACIGLIITAIAVEHRQVMMRASMIGAAAYLTAAFVVSGEINPQPGIPATAIFLTGLLFVIYIASRHRRVAH